MTLNAPAGRRAFLATAATATVVCASSAAAETEKTPAPAPKSLIPPPPEGKPGDFDFLTGEWRIHNRFLEKDKWIEFPGEATVWPILKGIGSIEELRIPARDFSGMGLRLLDVGKKHWSDHWVNAKWGAVGVPGQIGGFAGGAGHFYSEDLEASPAMLYRGTWDGITPDACRWTQSWSDDGGKTWHDTWYMQWTRVR